MIQITREPAVEPAALADVRARELPRVSALASVAGLDRETLCEAYDRHVNESVRPRVEEFRRASGGAPGDVAAAWSRLERRLLRRDSAFAGLSYDALSHLVPPGQRLSMPLRRPPLP